MQFILVKHLECCILQKQGAKAASAIIHSFLLSLIRVKTFLLFHHMFMYNFHCCYYINLWVKSQIGYLWYATISSCLVIFYMLQSALVLSPSICYSQLLSAHKSLGFTVYISDVYKCRVSKLGKATKGEVLLFLFSLKLQNTTIVLHKVPANRHSVVGDGTRYIRLAQTSSYSFLGFKRH